MKLVCLFMSLLIILPSISAAGELAEYLQA